MGCINYSLGAVQDTRVECPDSGHALTRELHGAPSHAGTSSKCPYTEDNPLRVVELFAGIGAQRTALKNLGISHDVVAIAENNAHALKAYLAVHNCQDLSIAGQQRWL